MALKFDMWHKDHGGKSSTTQAAYDAIWYPLGWRKAPPKAQAPRKARKTSAASAEDSTNPPAADDTAGSQEDPTT